MTNIVEDLSTLTTISQTTLNKLVKQTDYIICDGVHESILKNENITTVDIGIGTLLIKVGEEEIKYKFIPSNTLENTLIWTIDNHESPLVSKIESTLKDRVFNVYKELI